MRKHTLYTLPLSALLLITMCGWGWAVYDLWISWNQYQTLTIALTLAIFAVRWTLVVLGFLVFVKAIQQGRIEKFARLRAHSGNWLVIRIALYCWLPPLLVTSFLHLEALNLLEGNAFLMRSVFYSIFWIGLVLWAHWVLTRSSEISRTSKKSWWKTTADIICMNLVILLAGGEGLLWLFNEIRPSMLLYSRSSDILTRMNALRWGPGARYFNFRMNSKGYHDEEFFTVTSSDLVIGLLADSFGLGVVPYAYNFVTIAERELQHSMPRTYNRIAIHNFGVPGVAMNEYAFLLESEVLATRPTFVVLCLFMGNDIIESQGFGELPQSRYALQNWFLWLLPKRFAILIKEQQRQRRDQQNLNVLEIGRLTDGKIPDYIHDSSQEPPTFSPEKFLELEQSRFKVCNPANWHFQRGFEGIFAGLQHFQRRLNQHWLVVLIPDEFQVNDDVYAEILAANPAYAAYQREYPQQRIREFCEAHQIAYIDMLPVLREGQQRDRTYHLRDSHLNTYGNKLVGEALARKLSDMLAATVE